MPSSTNAVSVRVDKDGARKVEGDRSIIAAAESRIADAHWQGIIKTSELSENDMLKLLADAYG